MRAPDSPGPRRSPDRSDASTLRGADHETVRRALDEGDPLPGTVGFAGRVDGRLVRDALGRQPVFYDVAAVAAGASECGRRWAFDPTELANPASLPAGRELELPAAAAADANDDLDRLLSEPVERWSLPTPDPVADDEAAVASVREAVLESVREPDADGLAVAFSGGVDSALVAAGVPEAPCYVAGFEGSHDVAAAQEAAAAMDRDLRVVAFGHDDIVEAVPEVARATGRTNAMDVQIALPLYFAGEAAAADGVDRLAVGQGADELFGGYRKVVAPAEDHRVDADTVRGATREVVATLPDQLERDVLTLRAAGVDPVAPLLHDRVVAAALSLPAHLLATEGERKVALRRAAAGVVPESVRTAEKKAVQYGSYAARELDRLARRNGFKRRMDDHVRRYVESLVEAAEGDEVAEGDEAGT